MEQRGGKLVTVAIALGTTDALLGALPNDILVITTVQSNTPADGKLLVGDRIVKVNDVAVQSREQLVDEMAAARPNVNLSVIRGEPIPPELATIANIPPERIINVMPCDGFSYIIERVAWTSGMAKVGLGIKQFESRVLVSRCDKGSLSAVHFQVGDHLVDVDGTPVFDKDTFRELLIASIRKQRFATVLVERPVSPFAILKAKKELHQAESEFSPSVQMNSDILEIAAKQRQRYRGFINPAKGMLVRETKKKETGARESEKRVTICDSGPAVIVIASDHVDKKLRHVKKKNK